MTGRRGFFISFEGLDGAGKSTQVAALAAWLRGGGHDVAVVRPNDTALGEMISGQVLQHQARGSLHPWAEALLFNAGRVQLIAERIGPALARGAVVIADRFVDSTLAYQGGGRRLDRTTLRGLHRACCGDLWPDLTLYLEVTPEVGARRQRDQQLPLDRIEGAGEEFHQRVQVAFERLVRDEPERVVRIDAARPPLEVSSQVQAAVVARLPRVQGALVSS